jgi:hypothetical protein
LGTCRCGDTGKTAPQLARWTTSVAPPVPWCDRSQVIECSTLYVPTVRSNLPTGAAVRPLFITGAGRHVYVRNVGAAPLPCTTVERLVGNLQLGTTEAHRSAVSDGFLRDQRHGVLVLTSRGRACRTTMWQSSTSRGVEA